MSTATIKSPAQHHDMSAPRVLGEVSLLASTANSGNCTPQHHHHHRLSSADWTVPSSHASSPSARHADSPCQLPATPLVLPSAAHTVRFRHSVAYNVTKPVSAGARGMLLCKSGLPQDVTTLTGGSPTPLPSAHLTSCTFYSSAQLAMMGRPLEHDARELSIATATAGGVGTTALFFGQLGHGMTSAQMLALMHLLAPGAVMALPEIHSLGRGVGMGKGSCHARVRSDTLLSAVSADRGCYHDREGVWIATCEAGRRQLFVFEELMKFYANGFATGRPINLMTVSVASNQRLGLPSRM